MQVAIEFGDEAKWAIVSHLPPTVLYQLASPSTPPRVREAVLSVEAGTLASPGTVKALIADCRKRDARKEQRRRETQPTSEEMAAKARQQRRQVRERTEAEAERRAGEAKARHVAGILLAALGNDAGRVVSLLKEVQPWALQAALTGMLPLAEGLAA